MHHAQAASVDISDAEWSFAVASTSLTPRHELDGALNVLLLLGQVCSPVALG